MITEFFIAKRHILDRKFQSFVSIFGIAIALTVFVVSLAISNGLKANTLNSILTLSPHISAEIFEESQENYKEYIKELEKYNFKNINTRIESQGIVNVNGFSLPTLLTGTNLDKLDIKIVEGSKDNTDLTGVLVGNEFVERTGTALGDEITLITAETKEIRVQIKGIFKTGFFNYDSRLVILPIETMQLLQERGDVVSKIALEVDNPSDTTKLDNLVRELDIKYGDNLVFHSWNMDNEGLLNAIKFEKFVLIAILSLIILIASFAISVILSIIVREKTTDIGILKSVGYSNKNILKIFIFEGSIIGAVGMLLSIIISPIIIILLKYIFKVYVSNTYYLDSLPVSINIKEMVLIYAISALLILLSTTIPSIKASKMNPTDAIKYNN